MQDLLVCVRENAPFVFRGADGEYRGIAISLWERMAARLHQPFHYESVSPIEMLLERTHGGTCDVAVGSLTVTATRSQQVDFTHSFFRGGVGIATRVQTSHWRSLSRLWSPEFLQVVAGVLVVLIAVGTLMWRLERKRNPQFGGGLVTGLSSGLWWSAVTMTTVGYGDKAPVTPAGRGVALVWMFVSILTISSFTAAFASTLTVDRLGARVRSASDLVSVRVATVRGSSSDELLRRRGIAASRRETADAALALLRDDKVDAVVYDAPILRAGVLRMEDSSLAVLPDVVADENYAFAFPPGSAHAHALDLALLAEIESDDWHPLLDGYLGVSR